MKVLAIPVALQGRSLMDFTGPIDPSERIGTIDILRGMALFIVLIINTATEFRVSIFEQFLPDTKAAGLVGQLSEAAIVALHTKGFILFSFLFGIGLAIQFDRLSGNPRRLTLMVRRLAILLTMGIVHLFLIWNGDILTEYAIVGFAVLPFLFGPRWLLAAASAISLGLHIAMPLLPPVIAFPDAGWIRHHIEVARDTYGDGSFMEILTFRIKEALFIAPLHVYALPRTFGLFLFGAWVWRTGFFRATPRKSLMVGACFLLAIGAWLTFSGGVLFGWQLTWQNRAIVRSLAQLILAGGYGAAIVVIAGHVTGRKLLQWAGPVGRMAFTNYVVQSIILSCIFYGFGLALFGRLSIVQSLAIAAAIYAAQALFSAAWLRRFRFGPIEWLWRSLMYGERQRATAAQV
jgi:uncharacterized protein